MKKNESGNREPSVRFLRDEIALKDAAISKNEKLISALKEELKTKDEIIKALDERLTAVELERDNLKTEISIASKNVDDLLKANQRIYEKSQNNLTQKTIALIEIEDLLKENINKLNGNIIRLSAREKELLSERKTLAEIHENNLEKERLATQKERSAHADTKKWTRIIFWAFIATIITAGFFLKNDLSQKKEIDRLNTIIHAKESNPKAE